MALTETTEYDKIEIVGKYKSIQVRKKHIIKKDGVEIASKFERYAFTIGQLDNSDNLVETDISGEPQEVQSVCNAVWTTDVKAAYKTYLISQKTI
tara:strand:- start:1450 stop:1734 length:285 start_codon:yes stop_codon:yes gene_type:complete